VSVALMSFVSAAILAVSLAGFFSTFRYFELMSDFRPYWLAIGGAILMLIPIMWPHLKAWRRWRLAMLVFTMVSVVINGCEVLPWLWAAKPGGVPGSTQSRLKVIAFNVEFSNTRYAEVRAFVERESPDLVMFCEASGNWPGELLQLKGVLPYHARDESMDIEIFSRQPMGPVQAFHHGPRRGFITVLLNLRGREVVFAAAHAYPRLWPGADGFRWRNEMLEKGMGEAANSLHLPLIVMGDLNVSPWSPSYKRMIQASRLTDGRRGFGLLPTNHGEEWFSRWFWRPIDHCLHSPDITVARVWTGPELGSDHLPVLAEFCLQQ
jgi:endonuclease/exonuclease/phosphatase (EEP) superfamily protein YafD